MAAYRGLPSLLVAQGDGRRLSISVSDADAHHNADHNHNHGISSSHVFTRHVVPPSQASGFFLDAVPPRDQTTGSHPWLHDLAYYYIENLNCLRHFGRIFTRLDFIDLLASLPLQPPSRRPLAILTSTDTSTSTITSTNTCTDNTDMSAPKLLNAFQDEFDRQERYGCWPREYTDAILHLRQPRERGAREARECLMKARSEGRIQVEEASFSRAAPRNGIIQVTTVYPSGSRDPKRPCVVFCHGGAMAGSDRYVGLHVNGPIWAEALGAVTVSVEYGRAPENHGVGLARDCYEALVWCWEKVEFDHERLLLYGASAGGALAAGAALTLIHEQKSKTGLPKLCGLFLEAPMLDWRCDTDSMHRLGKDGPFFNREACVFAWKSVIQGKQVEFSEFVSPAEARKNDMAMLPPTAAYVGDMDPLLDEVVCFMEKPGRPDFTYRVFQGVPHGFDAILPAEPISVQAKDWRLQWIKTRFGIS